MYGANQADRRTWALASIDALVVVLSYVVLIVARFAGTVPVRWADRFWVFVFPVAALTVLVNHVFGCYRGAIGPMRAVVSGVTTTVLVVGFTAMVRTVPLSVAIGGGLLAAVGMAGVRMAAR